MPRQNEKTCSKFEQVLKKSNLIYDIENMVLDLAN